jgi:hypothetical protein
MPCSQGQSSVKTTPSPPGVETWHPTHWTSPAAKPGLPPPYSPKIAPVFVDDAGKLHRLRCERLDDTLVAHRKAHQLARIGTHRGGRHRPKNHRPARLHRGDIDIAAITNRRARRVHVHAAHRHRHRFAGMVRRSRLPDVFRHGPAEIGSVSDERVLLDRRRHPDFEEVAGSRRESEPRPQPVGRNEGARQIAVG